MWSELPDFICEKTEAQILLFAQSSMETKTENTVLQPHCSCSLITMPDLNISMKNLKICSGILCLVMKKHLFIINSMWNTGFGVGKEGVPESLLVPQAT